MPAVTRNKTECSHKLFSPQHQSAAAAADCSMYQKNPYSTKLYLTLIQKPQTNPQRSIIILSAAQL